MHEALNTQEIVLEIVSHLCGPRIFSSQYLALEQDEKSCLLAVALTCKFFRNPALDLLWFFMSDLIPLFKLIQNFCLDSKEESWFISGPLTEQDLECFNAYASRIRVFQAENKQPGLSAALLRVMYANSRINILTRLHHLSFHVLPYQDLLCLLHPELTELRFKLHFVRDISRTTDIFRTLAEKCPNVRRLEIGAKSITPGFSTSIYGMKYIEFLRIVGKYTPDDLDVFHIDPIFFSLLSSLDTLTYLQLGSYSPFACLPNDLPFSPVALPSLTTLDLFVEMDTLFSMSTHILGSNALPSLKILKLRFFHPNSPQPAIREKWESFCVFFSCIAPNLIDITLKSMFRAELSFSHFTPLISNHLRYLVIRSKVFRLKPTDIQQLSKCAPLLISLDYSSSRYNLLSDVAENLTGLSKLNVWIPQLEPPPLNDAPVSNNKLATLVLSGPHPPNDPIQAANYIHRIFPNLTSFSTPPSECVDGDDWHRLKDILGGIWSVRDDERIHLQNDAKG